MLMINNFFQFFFILILVDSSLNHPWILLLNIGVTLAISHSLGRFQHDIQRLILLGTDRGNLSSFLPTKNTD